jgi:quercetin dioxygenase-like cupin family protein
MDERAYRISFVTMSVRGMVYDTRRGNSSDVARVSFRGQNNEQSGILLDFGRSSLHRGVRGCANNDPNRSRAAVRKQRGQGLEIPGVPNSPLPFHRHEHPRVIIALTGGTMKILEETGQSQLNEWQTGKAYWLPANAPGTRHQDVNVGDKPIEVMVVELQRAK